MHSTKRRNNFFYWHIRLNFYYLGGDSNLNNDKQTYLLATCGNDSLVKLWQLTIFNEEDDSANGIGKSDCNISFKEKRTLAGHGGNVMDVRFSPIHGEILGSVATDRTARIWSVVRVLTFFI